MRSQRRPSILRGGKKTSLRFCHGASPPMTMLLEPGSATPLTAFLTAVDRDCACSFNFSPKLLNNAMILRFSNAEPETASLYNIDNNRAFNDLLSVADRRRTSLIHKGIPTEAGWEGERKGLQRGRAHFIRIAGQ